MRRTLAILPAVIVFLIGTSFSIQAEKLINDKSVEQQINCFSRIFSNYDSWREEIEKNHRNNFLPEDKFLRVMTRFDSNFSKSKFDFYKTNLSCINFNYLADGNMVKGFLIKPKKVINKLPVLIYNRGGNGDFGGVDFASMMHNLFPIAGEGFVIIGSQYRGTFTDNSALQDEFGGKDVDDVVALLNIIPNIEGTDAGKIGMYGTSRGGMQTFLTLKKANNVKAIATISGNSDLLKGLTYRPNMERVFRDRIPDYDKNKETELEKRSVMQWVDKLPINVPILLLHGTNDKRVSVKHSIDLAGALSKNKIPHKLVLYSEDNHYLSNNKDKANRELVSWFQKYL